MTGADARRRVEQRQHPRFPAWLVGRTRSAHGEPLEKVAVADLSLGGAAVHAPGLSWPSRFELALEWAGTACWLGCETVSREVVWGNALLHARFAALTAEQQGFLARVVHDLEAQLHAHHAPA